jgi:hypothetical protein
MGHRLRPTPNSTEVLSCFQSDTFSRKGRGMRIFWWQAGLHVEPESDHERTALLVLSESLNISGIKKQIVESPISIVEGNDQQAVASIDKLPEVIHETKGVDIGSPKHPL